jgi:hypothetical protein
METFGLTVSMVFKLMEHDTFAKYLQSDLWQEHKAKLAGTCTESCLWGWAYACAVADRRVAHLWCVAMGMTNEAVLASNKYGEDLASLTEQTDACSDTAHDELSENHSDEEDDN